MLSRAVGWCSSTTAGSTPTSPAAAHPSTVAPNRWGGATLAVCVFGIAMDAWWLFIIGAGLGALALCGLVFEYYRGEHAH